MNIALLLLFILTFGTSYAAIDTSQTYYVYSTVQGVNNFIVHLDHNTQSTSQYSSNQLPILTPSSFPFNPYHKWQFEAVRGGAVYKIKTPSGRCLDAHTAVKTNPVNGVYNPFLNTCVDGLSQEWELEVKNTNPLQVILRTYTGSNNFYYCLNSNWEDIPQWNKSTPNPSLYNACPGKTDKNLIWTISTTPGCTCPGAACITPGVCKSPCSPPWQGSNCGTINLASGDYYIYSWSTGGQLLLLNGDVGIPQPSTSTPTPFLTPYSNTQSYYKWNFIKQPNGYYYIKNIAADKCLDAYRAPNGPKTNPGGFQNPYLWTCGDVNHEWRIEVVYNNPFTVKLYSDYVAPSVVLDSNTNVKQFDTAYPRPFLYDGGYETSSNHLWVISSISGRCIGTDYHEMEVCPLP